MACAPEPLRGARVAGLGALCDVASGLDQRGISRNKNLGETHVNLRAFVGRNAAADGISDEVVLKRETAVQFSEEAGVLQ